MSGFAPASVRIHELIPALNLFQMGGMSWHHNVSDAKVVLRIRKGKSKRARKFRSGRNYLVHLTEFMSYMLIFFSDFFNSIVTLIVNTTFLTRF